LPERERWGSRLGFAFALAGFAVGIGNIWRMPYLTGIHGGAAFLFLYMGFAILVGVPLLTAEIALGRKAQLSPLAGIRRLTEGRPGPWLAIGWCGVLAAVLILSYGTLVVAWIVTWAVRTARGDFTGIGHAEAAAAFEAYLAQPGPMLAVAALLLGVEGLIITRGLRRGLERASRLLVPLLAVLLVVLAVGALTLPGAQEGVRWFLAPDFSALTAAAFLAALGQVFFSVGIGMAAAFVYGSYLHPTESDVPGTVLAVVGFDMLAALLAGLVIFPAVFAFGMQPDAGAGLAFGTMTAIFAEAPLGRLAGTAFFVLLAVAAVTSGLALLEAVVATVADSFGIARGRAVWSSVAVIYALGVPAALALGPWSHVRVADMALFTAIDAVGGSLLLALGGLVLAIYVAWVWGFERFQADANAGAGGIRVTAYWRPLVRWIVPLAVGAVLLSSLAVWR